MAAGAETSPEPRLLTPSPDSFRTTLAACSGSQLGPRLLSCSSNHRQAPLVPDDHAVGEAGEKSGNFH